MDSFMNVAAVQRLERYFRQIGDVLGEESRRGSFALYAMSLLGDGERKSVEPSPPARVRTLEDLGGAEADEHRLWSVVARALRGTRGGGAWRWVGGDITSPLVHVIGLLTVLQAYGQLHPTPTLDRNLRPVGTPPRRIGPELPSERFGGEVHCDDRQGRRSPGVRQRGRQCGVADGDGAAILRLFGGG